MPQRIAILHDVTLQSSHKQYQNNVRKYLRPYTDVSSKAKGKNILFHVRKLRHKFFFHVSLALLVSLAHGQNAKCTFLFLYIFDGSADTVAM